MSLGFKELASVCEAIGDGRQSVLLRKAGLRESTAESVFERRSFYLLPTRYHEKKSQPAGDGFQIRLRAEVIQSGDLLEWSSIEKLLPLTAYDPSRDGYSAVPSSDLTLNGDGKIEAVKGYTVLSEDEVFNILDEFNDYKVPIGNDQFYSVSDINAVELVAQNLRYDAAKDTVTDIVTGTIYSPDDNGSMVSAAGEEIEPGWTTTVGWRNFSKVINDERYRQPLLQVLAWTFIYAGLVVLSTFFLGLLLALVLNHPRMKSRKIYRTLLIVPYAMPSVLSTLVWAGMFNVDNGVINKILGSPIPWLSDPWLAKFAVLLVQLWAGTPYMFLIATGAIQSLSTETIEAAQVDGASPFQVFSKIKLPLVLMTLAPLLIASYAYNFSNFGAIYLLTGGGPTIISSGGIAGHTDILISYTYKIAFAAGKGNDYGLASAVSFFNFLLVSSMSIYSFKKSKTIENMT